VPDGASSLGQRLPVVSQSQAEENQTLLASTSATVLIHGTAGDPPVLRKNSILIPLDVASPNDDNSEERPTISGRPRR
jgi:hypothetical protein